MRTSLRPRPGNERSGGDAVVCPWWEAAGHGCARSSGRAHPRWSDELRAGRLAGGDGAASDGTSVLFLSNDPTAVGLLGNERHPEGI